MIFLHLGVALGVAFGQRTSGKSHPQGHSKMCKDHEGHWLKATPKATPKCKKIMNLSLFKRLVFVQKSHLHIVVKSL